MPTRTRLALTASLAMNAVLLGVLVYANFVAAAGRIRPLVAAGTPAPISTDNPWTGGKDGRSPSDYFNHLRGRGLTIDETKPLVLSRLEAEFLSDAREVFQEKYWEPGMNEEYLQAEIELAKGQDKVRAALIEFYGPEAQRDAAFRRVFRPLDPRLPVLTSAQQIAYQKYRFERQLAGIKDVKSAGSLVGQRPPAPGGAVSDHQSTVDELSRFLEPEAVEEVLYRYSALAEQIRSAGVDLTESEFREVFRLLEQLELGIRNADTYQETRNSLRRLLGADRFARVWAVRDPVYTALAATGVELGLTEATTLAAYQIINDRQELMAEVVELQFTDPERAKTKIREATAAQTERLSGLVGPEAAERLLRSLRIAAREFTGQSGERGRTAPGLPRSGQPAPLTREGPR